MNDVRKLLAGYATGTLTEAEQKALFAAALADDELFAALSDEEQLRELLSDSAARAELLARIEPAAPAFRERFAAWLQRPPVMAGFVTAAAAVLVLAIIPLFREPSLRQIAQIDTPVAAPQITRTQSPVASTPPDEPKRIARTTNTAAPRPQKKQAPQREAVQPQPTSPPATEAAPPPRVAHAEPPPPAQPLPAPAGMAAPPAEAAETRAGAATHFVTTADTGNADSPARRVVILKKDLSGSYSHIDPASTTLSQGDTVRVRVNPSEDGIVRIHGATPQPIVQTLVAGTGFETGDILVGAQDMRLVVSFGSVFRVGQPLVSSMRTAQSARAKSAQASQPVEIILRVKKP